MGCATCGEGVVAQTSVIRTTGEDNFKKHRLLRDGSGLQADWRQGFVFEGKAYHVTIGAFSTPIVGGGNGTVLDIDQPEGVISVPSGTSIIPLRIHVQTQAPLSVTDNDESEILIAVDRAAAWFGDGTKTDEVAYPMRTDLSSGSACACASAFTADMTRDGTADPALTIELARSVTVADVQGTAATVVVTKHELLYEPQVPPIIVGPAALYLYWGGTVATSGFAEVEYAELLTTGVN